MPKVDGLLKDFFQRECHCEPLINSINRKVQPYVKRSFSDFIAIFLSFSICDIIDNDDGKGAEQL